MSLCYFVISKAGYLLDIELMIDMLTERFMVLITEISAPLFFLINADKRIFWLYLCSGILLVLLSKKGRWQQILKLGKQSVASKYWFNRSTKIDLQWLFINQVLKALLIAPILISQVGIALWLYREMSSLFCMGDYFVWPTWLVMSIFTCVYFLLDDFSRFYSHYLYHKVPWLWRFHAIHHSAKVMTPLTLYRIHFIEYFINSIRAVLVSGLVSGVFMYLFAGQIGFVEIIGVNVFTLLFNLAGANLRHSHIWLGFGVFETVFISPAQHQIHHSNARQHLDKNFGATLALWDQFFGTWLASKNESVRGFGLYKQAAPQKLLKQLWGLGR